MIMLLLATLVMATSSATVCLASTRPGRENDPDAAFWYSFTGLCVLAPLILGPVMNNMNNRALSIMLLALAALAAVGTHGKLRRRRLQCLAAAAQARSAAVMATLAAQHASLLAKWSRYELDPAAAIDFPAMSDVRIPETAALIRALRVAAQQEQYVQSLAVPVPDDVVSAYRSAVDHLAQALETAELANCNLDVRLAGS